MRPAVAFVLLFLAGASLVCAPPPATASERDKALEFYESRVPAIGKYAAKALWRAAKAARDDDLHWQCVRLCGRILDWDPDHKPTRKHLGYVKKKGKWVKDPEVEVIRKNTRRSGESIEDWREKRDRWERKYRDPAEREIAERLAGLGTDCAKKGYPLQAQRAWQRALAHDTDQEEARAGLGFVKLGEHWLPQRHADHFAACSELTDATPVESWEKALGMSLAGSRSRHVQVVETSDKGWMPYATVTGELAYVVGLDLLDRKPEDEPFGRSPAWFLMCDEEHWETFMRTYKYKSETLEEAVERPSRGSDRKRWYVRKRRPSAGAVDDADFVAHCIGEMLMYAIYGDERAEWIWEGFAQHLSSLVVPVSDVRCVGKTSTRYGTDDDIEDRFEGSPRWRQLMHRVVSNGDEQPLRTLMSRDVSDMPLEEGIQCWSVFAWLHEHHREGFLKFIKDAYEGSDQPALLQTHVGLTPEQVDDEWRAYVLRNY
jgi:hypothetical protein